MKGGRYKEPTLRATSILYIPSTLIERGCFVWFRRILISGPARGQRPGQDYYCELERKEAELPNVASRPMKAIARRCDSGHYQYLEGCGIYLYTERLPRALQAKDFK